MGIDPNNIELTQIERTIRTYSDDEALVNLRRQQIAKSAVDIFSQKGYEHTTLYEIAKACSMAKGTLYHYVGAKQDILYLVIKYIMHEAADFASAIPSITTGLSATEGLSIAIRKYFEYVAGHEDIIIFLYRETVNLEAKFRKAVYQLEQKNATFYEGLIKKGIGTGEFHTEDVAMIAQNILVLGQMWAFRRWFLRKHCTLEEYITRQTNVILKIIS